MVKDKSMKPAAKKKQIEKDQIEKDQIEKDQIEKIAPNWRNILENTAGKYKCDKLLKNEGL